MIESYRTGSWSRRACDRVCAIPGCFNVFFAAASEVVIVRSSEDDIMEKLVCPKEERKREFTARTSEEGCGGCSMLMTLALYRNPSTDWRG